jgi:hypothetical protein
MGRQSNRDLLREMPDGPPGDLPGNGLPEKKTTARKSATVMRPT